MRLVEVVAVYSPYRAGLGTVARDNSAMAVDADWEVTVCTPLYPHQKATVPSMERIDGVQIKRLPVLLSYGNAAIMRGLFSELKKADVIHLHYPCIGSEWIVLFSTLFFHKKLLVTYHHDLIGKGFFRPLFTLYSMFFLPLTMRCANYIFATSWDYARESKLKKYLLPHKDTIGVVPCVVDITRFYPQAKNTKLLGKHGLTEHHQIILFVGALDAAHYFKGIDFLIDAFGDIAPVIQDSHLLIVGDGELRSAYEAQVKRLSLESRVHFVGSVSDEDLPRYYALADVCVLPSIDGSEAFGVVLVEAMACGKPVIASRIRGVRSVVRDGVDGVLVSLGSKVELQEALKILLLDRALRESFGKSALKQCREQYAFESVKKIFQKRLNTL